MLWDIFCKVIDNYGDAGVCWRLASDLSVRGHAVRLWIDDPAPLTWMAGDQPSAVSVIDWDKALDPVFLRSLDAGAVWIEAFGCDIPQPFMEQFASSMQAWINLEYLSAEPYVERCHGLPSPVMHGPMQGHTKYFFYPGWTANTGGLLREPDLLIRRDQWQAQTRADQFRHWGIDWRGETVWSLFCYEPASLPALLHTLSHADTPQLMLVTAGRATLAVQTVLQSLSLGSALCVHYLPFMPQAQYDQLLWSCDINCVRGEDSVVRAVWAGKPWLWQIYPQDDGAHVPKLDALLERLQTPSFLSDLHHAWNAASPLGIHSFASGLDYLEEWRAFAHKSCMHTCQQDDLCTQLIRFVGSLDRA